MPVQTEESLFHAARVLPSASEQQAFLESACEGDSELLARVQRLLKFHGSDESLIATGGMDDSARIGNLPTETQIGPYRLLEQIGEGGFGYVYVAEQTQPVKRQVALKILKPGMDSRQVVARFEAERQALALMDHPHIARVFDGGATAEGRPYFVMELVRGLPITEFCDAEHLTIRQRLELFVHVCQAVQHAHQKGIIHRDIKPSNVLVARHDATPVPKVIDFGIAKAVNQTLTDKSIYTQFAQMIGTPLYMSPEQAQLSGLDIDTRSDVYSLGVLLYELLTGTTPFALDVLREKGLDELRRMIREDEPVQPSRQVSTLKADAESTVSQKRGVDPRRLKSLLRGELDWIVMRALEKQRTQRYQSASDLAVDVERYLSNQTVEACPPSTFYRCRKYARRNRSLLATIAIVAIALLVGSAVSLWQASLANRARVLADKRLIDADRESKSAAASSAKARQSSAKARETIKKLLARVATEDVVKVPGMRDLYLRLLKDAEASYADLLQIDPEDVDVYMDRGDLYHSQFNFDAAVNDYRQALNLAPDNARAHGELAKNLVGTGWGRPPSNFEQALPHVTRAIELCPDDLRLRILRAKIYVKMNRPTDARSEIEAVHGQSLADAEISREIAAVLTGLQDNSSALPYAQRAVALDGGLSTNHERLGHTLLCLGRREEAVAAMSECIRLAAGVNEFNSIYWAYEQRGVANYELGKLELAIADFDKCAELGKVSKTITRLRPLANLRLQRYPEVLEQLDQCLLNGGDISWLPLDVVANSADTEFREEVHQRLKTYHSTLSSNSEDHTKLALADYLLSRKLAKADEELFQECIKLTPTCCNDQTGKLWWQIGRVAEEDGDLVVAEIAFQQALIVYEKLVRDAPEVPFWLQELAETCWMLANVQRKANHLDQAADTLKRGSDGLVTLVLKSPEIQLYRDRAFGQLFTMIDILMDKERVPEAVDGLEQSLRACKTLRKKREWSEHLLRTLHEIMTRMERLHALAIKSQAWESNVPDIRGLMVELETLVIDSFNSSPSEEIATLEFARQLFQLGSISRRMGLHDQELAAFESAITVWDKLPEPDFLERAQAHFRLKNYDAALADIDRFIQLYPADTRGWFPPDEVAACPDVGFQQGVLDLMAKSIERSERQQYLYQARAELYVAMNKLELARMDFERLLTPVSSARMHYLAALTALASGKSDYQRVCRQTLEHHGTTTNQGELYWVVWSCALGPASEDDQSRLKPLLKHAEKTLDRNRNTLLSLGALQFRLGQWDESERTLKSALEQPEDATVCRAYLWYFLAMTHERLDQHEQALAMLFQAEASREEMAKAAENDPAAYPWNRKLTLDLLDPEAKACLHREVTATEPLSNK